MFQESVKNLRRFLNLSQAAFGEKLGVSRSVVNNWERGVVEPTEMVIFHIRNTFNVNEHWLRTGEGEMFQETAKSYVESLIESHNMGPGGRALMRSLLRFYEELGEEATLKVIHDILPIGRDALAQAEHDKIIARWLGEDDKSQAE